MAGVCEIIPKAEYVVLGKTTYDQDYVDASVIAGATCGHEPPKPRPPELDARPPVKAPVAQAAPIRRSGIWQRTKDTFKRKPVGTVEPAQPIRASVPVEAVEPPAPAVVAPPPEPTLEIGAKPTRPPKRPRSAIEELLRLTPKEE